MPWYELNSADDPKLAELAERYHLHPLHLEDARSPDERVKVDQTAASYTFAVLKPVRFAPPPPGGTGAKDISFSTIDIFAGNHEGELFFHHRRPTRPAPPRPMHWPARDARVRRTNLRGCCI